MAITPEALARLRQLLGAAELAPLRQRLRQACAEAPPGQAPGPRRFGQLAAHEAEALQGLSGSPPRPSRSLLIDLAALGQRLQAAGLGDSLREALEALDGPLVSQHERASQAATWASLAQQASHPALRALLAQARPLGLLKRLAGSDPATAQSLCQRASQVLQALPAPGLPRARLAATCLGDAHALDPGQPVATLVLAVLRQAVGADATKGAEQTDGIDGPERAEEAEGAQTAAARDGAIDPDSQRSLWASQGVAVNELARPALSLNLPWPEAEATAGEPHYASLRRLLRQPPHWRHSAVAGRNIFVCENPNLLALAADTLGAGCAPLVCTDGMPAAAQRTLLQQLRAAGAVLHYHGDFDWPGLGIGNHVMRSLAAQPWRFGAEDYVQALAELPDQNAPLAGNLVSAAWDTRLASAMSAADRAVPEEAVFDGLKGDLAG